MLASSVDFSALQDSVNRALVLVRQLSLKRVLSTSEGSILSGMVAIKRLFRLFVKFLRLVFLKMAFELLQPIDDLIL